MNGASQLQRNRRRKVKYKKKKTLERTHRIYNPAFSEYVTQVMISATHQQKLNLSDTEKKIFVSETYIRKWCHSRTFELLIDMLQKLGMGWSFRVYNDEEVADNIEFLTVNSFQYPERRVDVTEAAAKHRVHHLTNREMVVAGHMCAQNVHSQVYTLSMNVKALAKRMRKVRVKGLLNGDIHEATHAIRDLNKLVLCQLNAVSWSLANTGLEDTEFRILCALFDKKNTALPVTQIEEMTQYDGVGARIRRHIKKLEDLGMIISDKNIGPKLFVSKSQKTNRKYYYMITPVGIAMVMKYLKYVHEKAFKDIE